MGHSKLKDDNEKVEELTDDETTEVYVVPARYHYKKDDFIVEAVTYLLWMFFKKKLTNLSRFSS